MQDLQAFHKESVIKWQAKCNEYTETMNAKSVEIEKSKDMRRIEDELRNAAHQDEILNLIGQHREELESNRLEMERKIKEITGFPKKPAPPAASVLPNNVNENSSNEHKDDKRPESSTQVKAEPKVRK